MNGTAAQVVLKDSIGFFTPSSRLEAEIVMEGRPAVVISARESKRTGDLNAVIGWIESIVPFILFTATLHWALAHGKDGWSITAKI